MHKFLKFVSILIYRIILFKSKEGIYSFSVFVPIEFREDCYI